jgi:hypothetical protein
MTGDACTTRAIEVIRAQVPSRTGPKYDASTGRFLTRDPIKDGRNEQTTGRNHPHVPMPAAFRISHT